MRWILLIYTVPSEPSRKRAFIWREIKKIGAIYLRDGVCALPEREETVATLHAIAAKVEEFDGQATLVRSAHLDDARAEAIRSQSRSDRATEYGEIAREAEWFLDHVRRETEHRDFTFAELTELEQDLHKLTRWTNQVRTRDYFGGEGAGNVAELLARCDEGLALFLEAVSRHDGGAA